MKSSVSFDYRSIMSRQRKGAAAALIRSGLWLASVPYRAAVSIRNRRYDRGSAEVLECGVPVISVGNLTTGGTGKTPIVCALARWFRERDVRVAIVSRGYGRGSEDSNDEAKELHTRLPDVPHVQDADRVAAARIAVEELESEVIIMDDGFQHRRLHRDLNIVVIDVTVPFGFGHLLPRGLLREPLDSLSRADLVILSRCSAVDEQTIAAIETRLLQHNPRIPIVRSDHRPSSLLEYPDHFLPIDGLAGQNVATVSAIGNPEAFEETVRTCGANVVESYRLGDHDAYDRETVLALREWIRDRGDSVEQIVCTHKDLVKLQTDRLAEKPVKAILIDLEFSGDRTALDDALEAIHQRIKKS